MYLFLFALMHSVMHSGTVLFSIAAYIYIYIYNAKTSSSLSTKWKGIIIYPLLSLLLMKCHIIMSSGAVLIYLE